MGEAAPGCKVLLMDNTDSQCRRLPIGEVDEQGNSFQYRPLGNGDTHRVLKNFYQPEELLKAMPAPVKRVDYRALDHFWWLTYSL